MSELKKPTIEGLVEKLLEGNHIEENEAGTVQALLEQASNGLNKDEIFTLVTKLNDKLDAHTSDLITPNGLNYTVFESEVKTVAQVINKEKRQREKSQTQATVEPLQEKKDIEKTPQEKAEIERQERINNNKNSLKDLIGRIPGADKLGLTEEDFDEIAECQETNDGFWGEVKNLIEEGKCSEEEAQEKTRKKYKLPEEYFKSKKYEIAELNHYINIIEVQAKEGKNIQQIEEEFQKDPVRYAAFQKMVGMFGKVVKTPFELVGVLTSCLGEKLTEFSLEKENELLETIDANEGKIRDAILGGYNTNVRTIKLYIDKLETARKDLVRRRDKTDGLNKNDKEISEFFEKMTKLYLSSNSNTTISKLYEKFKKNPKIKGIEFEEFLSGIEDNLRQNGNVVGDRETIDAMIEAERKFRRSELLQEAIDAARENGNIIVEEEYLKQIEKLEKKDRKETQESKIKFAKRRGIETGKDRVKVIKTKLSKEQLESDLERISADRKHIINMSRELGISTDEAAQKYFEANPRYLNLYTRRERKVLTGNTDSKNRQVKADNVLKKLRIFKKEKNDSLILIYSSELELLRDKISKGIQDPKELNGKIAELDKVKRKLKKAQDRKEKLEKKEAKPTKSKSAVELLERKEKKEKEKDIFTKYIKSGKSAMEFLNELNSDESNSSLDKEELLKIIKSNARKYVILEKLTLFIENERTIFYNQEKIEKLKSKMDLAKENNATSMYEIYERKIKAIEKNQERLYELTRESREKILIRMGLKTKNNERTENPRQQTEERQIIDSEETKASSIADGVKSPEEQEGEIKSGLAIEQIEITGVKPNVKAIAKKSKVTPSRIKRVFAKIVGLRKSKEKVAEQNEQETRPEEKQNKASTEAGAR